jgi:hypothetical protein
MSKTIEEKMKEAAKSVPNDLEEIYAYAGPGDNDGKIHFCYSAKDECYWITSDPNKDGDIAVAKTYLEDVITELLNRDKPLDYIRPLMENIHKFFGM